MTISFSGWGTGALPTFGWGLGGFVEGLSFGIWPEIEIDTEVFEPELDTSQAIPQLSAMHGPIAEIGADSLVPSIAATTLAVASMTSSGMERPVMNPSGIRPEINVAQMRTSEETSTILPSQKVEQGLVPSINTDIEEIG